MKTITLPFNFTFQFSFTRKTIISKGSGLSSAKLSLHSARQVIKSSFDSFQGKACVVKIPIKVENYP